jgi:hypothetical protein
MDLFSGVHVPHPYKAVPVAAYHILSARADSQRARAGKFRAFGNLRSGFGDFCGGFADDGFGFSTGTGIGFGIKEKQRGADKDGGSRAGRGNLYAVFLRADGFRRFFILFVFFSKSAMSVLLFYI